MHMESSCTVELRQRSQTGVAVKVRLLTVRRACMLPVSHPGCECEGSACAANFCKMCMRALARTRCHPCMVRRRAACAGSGYMAFYVAHDALRR